MEISLVSHFYNEELLIGDWIDYHKHFFDRAILINHHSTDNSVEIARDKLPEDWIIVDSVLEDFNAVNNDLEVMEYEKTLPGWKMAVNTTEYLFIPNFKETIEQLEKDFPEALAFGTRPVSTIDKVENTDIQFPIWKNRTHGFINYEPDGPAIRQYRYIHKGQHGAYSIGRHSTHLPNVGFPELLHLHLLYSPYPECMPRKLQIKDRIPFCDKINGFGVQHQRSPLEMEIDRQELLKYSYDLLTKEIYKKAYDKLLEEFK